MANGNLVKVNIIDQNGKSCDTSFFAVSTVHDPSDSGVQAVITALDDLIDGGAVANSIELAVEPNEDGAALAGGYNCADKIHVVLRSTTDGSTVIMDLPCPGTEDDTSVAMFNDDGTVNESSPGIADMIGFMNGGILDSGGNACVYVSARRTRSKGLKTAF